MADHTPSVVISELVKRERKRLGMSQEQLGVAVDVTQATISHWEGGKTTPNPAEAARLAAAIGRDVVQLLGELWPDVVRLDRLALLRQTLSAATDAEIRALEEVAAEMVAVRTKKRGRR